VPVLFVNFTVYQFKVQRSVGSYVWDACWSVSRELSSMEQHLEASEGRKSEDTVEEGYKNIILTSREWTQLMEPELQYSSPRFEIKSDSSPCSRWSSLQV